MFDLRILLWQALHTMASEFIGYNVLVTLKAPPNATLQGQVANVIGQRLVLQNGMWGSYPSLIYLMLI